MKFAEFHAGKIIEAGPYLVDEEEMLRFAKAYDPQWFHVDPKTAAEGRYGGLIASGWQTCAIGMRLAVDSVLIGSETVGSPGVAESNGRTRCAPATASPCERKWSRRAGRRASPTSASCVGAGACSTSMARRCLNPRRRACST